jgi:prepilin-type processing-associated H-X9-DG protein
MVLQVGKASTLSGTLCAINADGEIVNRTAVDGPMVYAPTVWSADGSTLLFQDMRKRSLLKPQPDGTFAKTSEQPYKPTERNPELVLTAKPGVTKIRSEHKNLSSLWLSSAATTEHPDAFISADGTDPSIAPTYDAVFYEEGGIAKIRTWTPLTDEQKKSLMDAIKADAISAAKQVALGLLMFSTDNDDVLPGSGGLDSLLPYLKDSSLLDGFNYTPPANLNSSQWTSPSETVVGTVLGPGGSAVAYGDGHVKWHPNP